MASTSGPDSGVRAATCFYLCPTHGFALLLPAPHLPISLRHSFVVRRDQRVVIVNKVVRWGRCFGKENHFLFCETIVSNCAAVPLVVTCSSLVNTVTHFTRAQVAFSTRLTMGWPVKRDNTHPIVIISDQSDGFQTSFSYLLSQL